MRLFSHRRIVLLALAIALSASTFIATGASASGSGSVASNAQVLAAVKSGQSITRVPSNLKPVLTNENDIEVLNNGACPAHYTAPKVGLDDFHYGECTYGDPSG